MAPTQTTHHSTLILDQAPASVSMPGKWAFAAAAVLAALVAVELVVQAHRPGSAGWLMSPCDDSDSAQRVAEPLLRGEVGCVEWRSVHVQHQTERLQIGLDTTAYAEVFVGDGAERPRLQSPPGPRRTVFVDEPLVSGVTSIRVRAEARPGDELRLYAMDLRRPYAWGFGPLASEAYWTSRRAARRALAEGPRDRTWSALRIPLELALLFVFLALGLRRRPVLRRDIAWLSLGTGVAGLLRIPASLGHDIVFDELAYSKAGAHFVRNLLLGDGTRESWRWNREHPPIAKWLLGLGDLMGGFEGARVLCAALSVATTALVYGIARRLGISRTGAGVAMLLFAVGPRLVGLGRICSLETFVLFFWALTLWLCLGWRHRVTPRDLRLRLLMLIVVVGCLGLGSRATCVWVAIPVLLIALPALRALKAVQRLAVVGAGLAGLGLGLGLIFLAWRYLWEGPLEAMSESYGHFARHVPRSYYFGAFEHPPPDYFLGAFAVSTSVPTLVLAGLAPLLALRGRRPWTSVVLLSLVAAPMLQSFSQLRWGGARYVAPAWLGVALLCGWCVAALDRGRGASRRSPFRQWRWRPGWILGAALVLFEAGSLASVEPYPLAYFNLAVGGPRGVEAGRVVELVTYSHGVDESVDYINAHAPYGAHVLIDAFRPMMEPLRSDLRATPTPVQATYVLADQIHFKANDGRLGHCAIVYETRIRGAVLSRVWRCR